MNAEPEFIDKAAEDEKWLMEAEAFGLSEEDAIRCRAAMATRRRMRMAVSKLVLPGKNPAPLLLPTRPVKHAFSSPSRAWGSQGLLFCR